MKHIFAGVVAALFASTSFAQQSTSKSMSFEECLQVIQRTATQLGVAPINIAETTDMRMVRFPTCVFHAKLDTDSTRIWTVIPGQTGQSGVAT